MKAVLFLPQSTTIRLGGLRSTPSTLRRRFGRGCLWHLRETARRIGSIVAHNGSERENVMTTLELKLNLPDSLAKEAARMGLLDPDSLQALLREAVRNRRIAQLAGAREKIAAAGVAPLTMEEIQAEIEADRAERRGKIAN